MNLTINNYDNKRKYNPNFKCGALTAVLGALDTNPMANAVVLDLGTMVAPRTYFDTKERNKYAGAETFLREISGTFINCLSAGLLGVMLAKTAANFVEPGVKINTNSWFSDDSIKVLKSAWDNSGNNTKKYVENVFENITARDGNKKVKFSDIDWGKTQWQNVKGVNFDNPKYKTTAQKLTSREGFIQTFSEIINDRAITNHDKKELLNLIEKRLTNALKANRELNVNIGGHSLDATLGNIIRDTYDMGKDVFTNKNVDINAVLGKIKKVNNIKIFGALSLASLLGISAQRINRKITEKRTGKKGFVGEVDYLESKTSQKDNSAKLWIKKIAASIGMAAMVLGVMKVKNPADFVKKLQFTGPVSTGNAIKTVYASTIIGRFLAADSGNELRESVVRDYFGFLNWLVLGGFAAKGVANILDPKKENLFNINKEGKGIKHWLNDLTLKTHDEIYAQGKTFAKKNIWKLNLAHIGGLAYTTLMLGMLLPKINIKMTKNAHDKHKLQSA